MCSCSEDTKERGGLALSSFLFACKGKPQTGVPVDQIPCVAAERIMLPLKHGIALAYVVYHANGVPDKSSFIEDYTVFPLFVGVKIPFVSITVIGKFKVHTVKESG